MVVKCFEYDTVFALYFIDRKDIFLLLKDTVLNRTEQRQTSGYLEPNYKVLKGPLIKRGFLISVGARHISLHQIVRTGP
jgi:hypothetical protein